LGVRFRSDLRIHGFFWTFSLPNPINNGLRKAQTGWVLKIQNPHEEERNGATSGENSQTFQPIIITRRRLIAR
jgi:hypothetical protein